MDPIQRKAIQMLQDINTAILWLVITVEQTAQLVDIVYNRVKITFNNIQMLLL